MKVEDAPLWIMGMIDDVWAERLLLVVLVDWESMQCEQPDSGLGVARMELAEIVVLTALYTRRCSRKRGGPGSEYATRRAWTKFLTCDNPAAHHSFLRWIDLQNIQLARKIRSI